MPKPTISTIPAVWDDEASAWSGHCHDISIADAPTLDELLAKISAWRSICCPTIIPAAPYLQITALREAEQAVA